MRNNTNLYIELQIFAIHTYIDMYGNMENGLSIHNFAYLFKHRHISIDTYILYII